MGFGNFAEMLHDPAATQALWHTLVIAVAITLLQNGIGLLPALGVNSTIKSRTVLRVFPFAPALVTPIVAVYLWRNLLGPDGAVNSLLGRVGLDAWRQDWLGDPGIALWSVVGVTMLTGIQEVFSKQSTPDKVLAAMDTDYKSGS